MTGLDALNKTTPALTIAFLGGSITEGTDRATPGSFYVDIVGKSFKQHFSEQKVNIINAGWGGTGSEFGLFRLYDDVCAYEPDLVFVEFACNDILKTDDDTVFYMENIVRNLINLPKIPCIVFIYTTDNKYNTKRAAHRKVAKNYSIPEIDIQSYIKALVSEEKISFDKIFGDNIHPNDSGYKIYADYIINCIFGNTGKFFRLPKTNAPLIGKYEIKNPRFVPAEKFDFSGKPSVRPFVNRHLPRCFEMHKGEGVSFRFSGNTFGILCEDMHEKGKAECIIDGKIKLIAEEQLYKPALICHSLKDCSHTAEIKVVSDVPFCPGGFLFNE